MGSLELASPWPQVVSVLHYLRLRPLTLSISNQFKKPNSRSNVQCCLPAISRGPRTDTDKKSKRRHVNELTDRRPKSSGNSNLPHVLRASAHNKPIIQKCNSYLPDARAPGGLVRIQHWFPASLGSLTPHVALPWTVRVSSPYHLRIYQDRNS